MKKRQEKVLMAIVKEYVKKAEPVSSQLLFEKYNFNASPATLRLDMAELTEGGYLIQPHTSAGRIPTEKAYHFYIKKISNSKLSFNTEERLREIFRKKKDEDFWEELGEFLSRVSRSLSLICLEDFVFWQGLSILFSQPEFYHRNEILDFARTFEQIYENFSMKIVNEILEEEEGDVNVFIGEENPIVKSEDLSLILGRVKKGFIGFLGPQRMDYQKNIALLKKTKEYLDEYYF